MPPKANKKQAPKAKEVAKKEAPKEVSKEAAPQRPRDNPDRKNKMILRRMERILGRRVKRMDITIYQGGFVQVQDVMDKAPLFKRMSDMTCEQVCDLLAGDEQSRFTTQTGGYAKVNTGHAFDVNDTELPAVPTS